MNVYAEVRAMAKMTMADLKARYADLFGEQTRSCNRDYLVRRIAWHGRGHRRSHVGCHGGVARWRDGAPILWLGSAISGQRSKGGASWRTCFRSGRCSISGARAI